MTSSKNIAFKFWTDAMLHSYSQIFFSQDKIFALLIMLVSFFNVKIGCCGFLAVVCINIFAFILGLNRHHIQHGIYGFNALLLGLSLGYTYNIGNTFALLFLISILFLLVITVWLEGFFKKINIPFLVFPFLIVYWIISLSSGSFTHVQLDESHIYLANTIALKQHSTYYQLTHVLDKYPMMHIIRVYFRTLNGIFFQDTILGGILLSLGLLYHSRISFSLSIIGFLSAFFFFKLLGADTAFLSYHLLGSNFILMSIAIGCFFVIPNIYSYLIVFALTPVLMLLLFSIQKILFTFQLNAYTVSFSILVTMFIYFLHQRWFNKYLHLVSIQHYSPEKTIYKHISATQRFENVHTLKIQLPFFGKWKVSQGYNGSITHLDDWSKALDFVIVDEDDKTYKHPGISKDDFYCYNKPVLAPADGIVYNIINNVEDNDINNVDTNKNWGNTIILQHGTELYSQISHMKKDSFKVNIGDSITKGTILANCGNSGRSPEPHIHFQLQTTPKVGDKTLSFPIAYFIKNNDNKNELKISEIPKENDIITNVETTPLLTNAFHFIPGKKMKFTDEENKVIEWEIFTDAWNRTYIYCHKTQSVAYFINDGTMFYFYDFEGDKNAVLFHFYLGFYRVLLGFYHDIQINDQVPLLHFNNKVISFIQDFIAPFYLFSQANYHSSTVFTDDVYSPQRIELKSAITTTLFNAILKKTTYNIVVSNNKIEQFSIQTNNKKQTFLCVD